ncbi:uncharacterized protein BXZ73DRAFT_100485 [Epithele typhae]|uniref:uncharacterized protein n=1 Tax=Epithele typhae TaxID=378194 RepID=UPI0020079E72|nr:uncharacterized protein BXZ73DRAFT_100485 [Epithele typhae]KAH9935093.1 hypothetical protein BXZ73DRAFT_100485 [Epithele typhae]
MYGGSGPRWASGAFSALSPISSSSPSLLSITRDLQDALHVGLAARQPSLEHHTEVHDLPQGLGPRLAPHPSLRDLWPRVGLVPQDVSQVPPYPHRDPIEALKAYFYTRRTFPFLDRMLGVLSVLGPYGRAREDMGRLQGWQRNAQAICAVFNLLNDAKLLDNVPRFVGRIDTLLMLVRTVQGEAQNIGVLGVIDARAWATVAAA